jgi:hypothetical protein
MPSVAAVKKQLQSSMPELSINPLGEFNPVSIASRISQDNTVSVSRAAFQGNIVVGIMLLQTGCRGE